MRRQGLVWLAAAVVALGAAACFSDPTSSLRGGATRIQLSQYTVTLKAGDSVTVRAYVLDDQGNQLDVGTPSWSSADSTIASVRPDVAAPGEVFANGVVKGINNQAGITTLTVTLQGVQATIRVTVLPATFPGTRTITGTAVLDTVRIKRPAPLPDTLIFFTQGDTLTYNATATVTFNAATASVTFGSFPGYVISRSATQLKVMSRQPFAGKPTINNLVYAGNAQTGAVAIASMPGDSINLQRSRFHGTVNVTGDTITLTANTGTTFSASTKITFGVQGDTLVPLDTAVIFSQTASVVRAVAPLIGNPKILGAAPYTGGFTVMSMGVGPVTVDSARGIANVTINRATFPGTVSVGNSGLGSNTLATVTPSAGGAETFTTGSSGSVVTFNTTAGTMLSRAAAQLQNISTTTISSKTVKVTKVKLGIATIDSLRTPAATYSINASFFPGTITNGTGNLLDTVFVLANGTGTFDTTTGAGSAVTINGKTALTIRRTVDTIRVFSVLPGTAKVSVSNFIISGPLTVPSLTTSGNTAVTSTTGEANEPGNDAYATATALAFTGAADTIVKYGSVDCEDDGTACPGNGDAWDYYTFSLGTTNTLRAIVNWYGTGSGGNPYGVDHTNPDLDVVICAGTAGSCSYGKDITAFSGAGTSQPEIATTATTQAPGTYYVRVYGYSTPSPIAYRLRVLRM